MHLIKKFITTLLRTISLQNLIESCHRSEDNKAQISQAHSQGSLRTSFIYIRLPVWCFDHQQIRIDESSQYQTNTIP